MEIEEDEKILNKIKDKFEKNIIIIENFNANN